MTAGLTPLDTHESRVVLSNISWGTYESLLADLEDCSAPRLTYDRGSLEIENLSFKHELFNGAASLIVNVLAEEFDINSRGLGSTTFRREDLKRGFEPDSCFYFQNEPLIRDKDRLDLMVDPPPDLVVEIDIPSPSLDKFSIFAQLGVPEVWRYDGTALGIFHLEGGSYVERQLSGVLPVVTNTVLTDFLSESLTGSRLAWLRKVRGWAREQHQKD
ncbi:MAG: Uma2 family endonuclease [Pyrinomonadaceae bacterium]|nr:Uma2 family endonuclease [Pyrinomonadaceae bacterium]